MMQFKLWFENLIFDKDHQTPSRYLDFLDDSEKQNPQKLAWLNKLSSHKIYKFPLAKEKFIHFSLTNDIEDIQRAKVLNQEHNFAISVSYGSWIPVVQYNHIITKNKQNKFLAPMDLKNKNRKDKMLARGYQVPNFQEEISAIIFQTNVIPKSAHKEEVIWSGQVPLISSQIVSSREAIRLLKNVPYKIGDNDEVNYF